VRTLKYLPPQPWPRWDPSDTVQRGLESFANALLKRRFARTTAVTYTVHVARGWADPIGYLRSLGSWQRQQHAKHALSAYADHIGQGGAIQAIKSVPEPIKPDRRPVHLPDLVTWQSIGPRLLQRHPGPLGHVLWILVYSGLRIGDLCGLTRYQVERAARDGAATIGQKGKGGTRKRWWKPVDDVRPALAALASEPGWSELWQASGASSKRACENGIRKRLPAPFTPHDFRRAFATYLYAQTRDLKAVAIMGGWESVQAVERYIVHVPPEQLEPYRIGLSKLLFPHGNPYRTR
jgi:integrase